MMELVSRVTFFQNPSMVRMFDFEGGTWARERTTTLLSDSATGSREFENSATVHIII
jgi:hypothetical protein